MNISKHIAQTCLVIINSINSTAEYIELGTANNFTESMIHTFEEKLPALKIYNNQLEEIINYKYAVITDIGNFIEYYNLSGMIDRLVEQDLALIGHILQTDDYYELHHQCFVIDVDKWKKIGKPGFTEIANKKAIAVERSIDNLHDDYTPTWIKADLHPDTKQPYMIPIQSSNIGSKLISNLLYHNYKISAFTKFERKHKYYLYPGTKWFYQALFENESYGFWNENIENIVSNFPKNIEQYFGVASPYFILIFAKHNPNCKTWYIIDSSDVQLLYCKYVLKEISTNDPIKIFNNFFREYPWIRKQQFESINQSFDLQKNIEYIKQNITQVDLGKIHYKKQNLWIDQTINIENKKTLVYLSNVFKYQPQSKWFPLSKQQHAEKLFLKNVYKNKYIHSIIKCQHVHLLDNA